MTFKSHSRSSEMSRFVRTHNVSYYRSTVSMYRFAHIDIGRNREMYIIQRPPKEWRCRNFAKMSNTLKTRMWLPYAEECPHFHTHLFIDITKYNHSINEPKYNMISNGWLKKGKIPVKYSQPIHRKYVYKINQHSINQHSKTE